MNQHKHEQTPPAGPTNPLPPEDLKGEEEALGAGEHDTKHPHGVRGDEGGPTR